MSLSCLDTLIGLSSRDCNCTSGSRPSGYNTSATGYYLDDYEYGVPMSDAGVASTDCGESSVWDVYSTARSNAIRDVKVDIQQALTSERDSNVINWRGTIAKAEATSYLSNTSGTAGMQVRPKYRLKDATLVVKAIWLGLDTTKSVALNVSSNDGSFTGSSVSLNATAGTWVRNALETNIELPLYSIARTDVKYNFTFDLDGAKVYQNRISCCSPPQWMNHLEVGGVIESGDFSDTTLYANSYGYGVVLEAYFSCNKLDWICDLEEMNGLDFRDYLGRVIQFKAAIKLIDKITNSGNVNYYTLLGADQLQERKAMLSHMYAEYITWIAQNFPDNISSCWGCSKRGPRMQSILV